MVDRLGDLWQSTVGAFMGTIPMPTISSIVDILLVALIFYGILRLFQGTQAVSLLRGILVVALVATIAASRLTAFNWLVRAMLPMILVAIPVIFQPELRRALRTPRPDRSDHRTHYPGERRPAERFSRRSSPLNRLHVSGRAL